MKRMKMVMSGVYGVSLLALIGCSTTVHGLRGVFGQQGHETYLNIVDVYRPDNSNLYFISKKGEESYLYHIAYTEFPWESRPVFKRHEVGEDNVNKLILISTKTSLRSDLGLHSAEFYLPSDFVVKTNQPPIEIQSFVSQVITIP